MRDLSLRVSNLSPSLTLTLAETAKKLKLSGKEIISLGVGEPDFNTPDHIIEAAYDSMKKGMTKYTPSSGVPELKKAIIDKFYNENNLRYSAEQITVTVGAKQALYNCFQAILDPGDEVILLAPYWVSYIEQVKLAGGVPKIITTDANNSFKATPEEVERAISSKTKAILINTPSNPTGSVYTREELQALGEVCLKHNLLIISDEIYEHLVYDDNKHVSIASISQDLYEQTLVINGVSKAYAMTGWRVGYAAGPRDVIKSMTDIASHSTSSCTSISQYAAIAALAGTQAPREEMVRNFKLRRDFIAGQLNQLKEISYTELQGAFYAFINVSKNLKKGQTGDDWAAGLLNDYGVVVVPGRVFGYSEYVRLSYATSMQKLEKAMQYIDKYVNQS